MRLKTIFAFAILILFLLPQHSFSQTDSTRIFTMQDGDTTYVMKQYWFVLLMRGDKANTFSKTELDSIQAGHMANMNRCAELGKLVMAGPFGDDGDWRGIFIFDCNTKEEVIDLIKDDTAIHAGRLKYEIHPWWGAMGTKLP